MDAFGIITRSDWLMSPAANVLLATLRNAAVGCYGHALDKRDAKNFQSVA
jgi:hypothetical protein